MTTSCDWTNQLYIENGLNDTIAIEYIASEYANGLIKNPKLFNSIKDIKTDKYDLISKYDSVNDKVTTYLPPDKLLHFGYYWNFENGEVKILNSQIKINIGDSILINDYELLNYFDNKRGYNLIFTFSDKTLSEPKNINRRTIAFKKDTVLISIGKNNPKPRIKYLPTDNMVIETVYMFGKPYYQQTFIKGEEYSFISFDKVGNIKSERYYVDSETVLKRDFYSNGQLKYIYDKEKGIELKYEKEGVEIQ